MSDGIELRIAKLLALAMDQDGTPEGCAAAAMAAKLMQRHGITEAQVAGVEASQGDPIERLDLDVPAANWRRLLLAAIADYLGLYPVYGGREFHLFGRRSKLRVAQYLNEILLRQCEASTAAAVEMARSHLTVVSRTFRTRWRTSFVAGVGDKLRAMAAANSTDDGDGSTSGNSLVVASDIEAARRLAESAFRISDRTHVLKGLYAEGVAAGRSAQVVDGIEATRATQRALPSA